MKAKPSLAAKPKAAHQAPNPSVIIPLTKLGTHLAEAAAIKRQMATLLRELETQAGHTPAEHTPTATHTPTKPGGWRHHLQDWGKTRPQS